MNNSKFFFLDTQVFDSYQYNFDSALLKKLSSVCVEQNVSLVMPEVIRREIEKHVKEKASKAGKDIVAIRREHPFLRNIAVAVNRLDQLEKLKFDEVLLEQLGDFLASCSCLELDCGYVNVAELVDDYFEGAAPFGTGKKRKEFPDAIAAKSILGWAASKGVTVSIISNDNDWKRFCELHVEVTFHASLAKFLATFPDPDLSANLRDSIEKNSLEISKAVSDDFELLGFYPTSVEHIPDVVDDISEVDSSIEEVFIVSAEGDKATAEVLFEVTFDAEVTFEDASTGIWDSEEKEMVGMELCRKTISQTWNGLVELNFTYDAQNFDYLKIESISIPDSDIEVCIDEDHYF